MIEAKGALKAATAFVKMKAGIAPVSQRALDKYGFVILGKTMMASPVDTGRFRAAWRTGRFRVAGATAGIYITNTMPYSGVLEYGSPVGGKPWKSAGPKTVKQGGRIFSKKAPKGVIGPQITETALNVVGAQILKGIIKRG